MTQSNSQKTAIFAKVSDLPSNEVQAQENQKFKT